MKMIRARLLKLTGLLVIMIGLFWGVVFTIQAQDATKDKIASAMSAAPQAVSAEAAIFDFPTDGSTNFVVLREGDNGWWCFPDTESTPGNDPQCLDAVWMDAMKAAMAGKDPIITAPGLGYMLMGGSDASNTDPNAMEPAPGDEWVTTPAHIMLLLPGKLDTKQFGTDDKSGKPWIMFADTPLAHIMMPVADHDH